MVHDQQHPRCSQIIGLCGYAKAGKDTVADILVEAGYTKYSFAKPLKIALAAILNEDVERLEDREYKESVLTDLGKSPRYLMQTLGTEWGRKMVRDDIWLIAAERQLAHTQKIVISDVRFPNEAEWIKKHGGIIVRIERPDLEVDLSHVSEQHIASIEADVIIFNDMEVRDLRDKCWDALELPNLQSPSD